MANAATLINQTSGKTEYGTPREFVDAARMVMGSIELDPASSPEFNMTVGADRFFTKEEDGLKQVWRAKTVWMNHPFHKQENKCPTPHELCTKKGCKTRGYHLDEDMPGNSAWVLKLVNAWANAHLASYVPYPANADIVHEAMCITYALTSEVWFRPLKNYALCLLDGRTNYRLLDGTTLEGSTKGSAVTYLGKNIDRFYRHFRKFGSIHVPYVGI